MLFNEFDKEKTAIINPSNVIEKIKDFPKVGVTCFSHVLLESVLSHFEKEIIAYIQSANGKSPIFKVNYNGSNIAIFMSRVGASACTVGFEEIIAMGLEKLIMFGTCGVLDSSLDDLAIIIPNSAIRDEGTSYHYVQESDEITVNDKYQTEFIEILNKYNYSYTVGKTWTTDAPYRETQNKMLNRKKQGAICVEMECASMSAIAQFRNVDFFQFLYAADNLDSANWDKRSLSCLDKLNQKEKIALLAFELSTKMICPRL